MSQLFSNESTLHIMWPKYWSFSISPSNEYSGLISFRIDWFDLLAIQGTLKSVLQYHNSKRMNSSTLGLLYGPSPHQYMTTGKSITLAIQTFVSKVMSLLFNTLSSFVIAFFLRNVFEHHGCTSLFTVIMKPKKIKSTTTSTFSHYICHEVMGLDAMI